MTIALLGRGGDCWLDAVAGHCRRPTRRLDQRAPMQGGEVLVDGERILWEGFDLTAAEAVLVERPAFAWPQPGIDPQAGTAGPRAEREARALLVSALHAAGEVVPVLDPPRASDLAISPLLALDRCAAAGLGVQPWVLVPERPADDGRAWLDPVGADLWYRPDAPRPGEPAFSPEPFPGGVLSLLVVGARAVGARRFVDAGAWVEGTARAFVREDAVPAGLRDAAVRALLALELSWLQVDLLDDAGRAAILTVRAGVDLQPWDRDLDGAVSRVVAELLDRTAAGER